MAFLVGVVAYNLIILNFNKEVDYKPTEVLARVSYIGKKNDSYLYLQADSVELDGNKINENIIIYL